MTISMDVNVFHMITAMQKSPVDHQMQPVYTMNQSDAVEITNVNATAPRTHNVRTVQTEPWGFV